MPRHPSYSHTTVDEFKQLDILRLRRTIEWTAGSHGQLIWWHCGKKTGLINFHVGLDGLRLMYRTRPRGGEWRSIDDFIPFTYTELTYGRRQWFVCPSCLRRCRILYGGALFRCRKCVGAVYDSQYEQLPIRISDQRWKIRRWLHERGGMQPESGDLDPGAPFLTKPKWMRWPTYNRVKSRDQKLEAAWMTATGGWMRKQDARFIRSHHGSGNVRSHQR